MGRYLGGRGGVPNLLVHDLRRTAVRNLRRLGFTEKTTMEISGHKPAVFKRYDIVDEADLNQAALDRKRLSPLSYNPLPAEKQPLVPNVGKNGLTNLPDSLTRFQRNEGHARDRCAVVAVKTEHDISAQEGTLFSGLTRNLHHNRSRRLSSVRRSWFRLQLGDHAPEFPVHES